MSKILLVSHSPLATTGYGRVVRCLAENFRSAGHGVVCLGMGGDGSKVKLPYATLPWPGMSRHLLAKAILDCRPDVLLTLGDPWMFESLPASQERKGAVWMAYFPIDGYPLPSSWAEWVRAVDVPVTFSKFAQTVVHRSSGVRSELIHHGVDTQTFSPGDRDEAKTLAKVAGKFVVGCVARNQLRKNLPALVKAFARFSRGKDDVVLYLHTQLKGDFDLPELARTYTIGDKLRLTGEIGADKGVSDRLMATVYRAMDLFVLPTMAEGFGLPIIEAQACGTPVLVTDFSACPELVPDPVQRLKVKTMLTMGRNFEQAVVDEDDITAKLEYFYRERSALGLLGERCSQFARKFEWSIAYQQFHELLASPRCQSKSLSHGK